MRARAVDWALLGLVAFEFASGLGSFLIGRPEGWPWFWVHSAVGLALVFLIWWKLSRVYRRVSEPRRWQWATLVSVLTAIFSLLTIGTGAVWTFFQRPLGYPNGMILHTSAAIALVIIYLWHTLLRFKPLKMRDVRDRRTVLSFLGALIGGGALLAAKNRTAQAVDAPGADRRFTGSRLAVTEGGEPQIGNDYPVTMWMFDRPARVDRDAFVLHVTGLVERPQRYDWAQIATLPQGNLSAALDCTGGWYTEQTWRGVRVGDLLDAAAVQAEARAVSFRSITGYRWSLPLDEARAALLATHVLDADGTPQPISHGHGAPLRLVAPGRRGFQWVKWVTAVEVFDAVDLSQWRVIFTSGLG